MCGWILWPASSFDDFQTFFGRRSGSDRGIPREIISHGFKGAHTVVRCTKSISGRKNVNELGVGKARSSGVVSCANFGILIKFHPAGTRYENVKGKSVLSSELARCGERYLYTRRFCDDLQIFLYKFTYTTRICSWNETKTSCLRRNQQKPNPHSKSFTKRL